MYSGGYYGNGDELQRDRARKLLETSLEKLATLSEEIRYCDPHELLADTERLVRWAERINDYIGSIEEGLYYL